MTSGVLVTNPFTDEYVHQELEFLGPLKYRNRKDTVRIERKKMRGRIHTRSGDNAGPGEWMRDHSTNRELAASALDFLKSRSRYVEAPEAAAA